MSKSEHLRTRGVPHLPGADGAVPGLAADAAENWWLAACAHSNGRICSSLLSNTHTHTHNHTPVAMPPYYAQTRVARSTLSQLVGKLDVPIAKQRTMPWAEASRELRCRVYAVRQPNSNRLSYVSVKGTALHTGQHWQTTLQDNAWNLWHTVGTHMLGPNRADPDDMSEAEAVRYAQAAHARAEWEERQAELRRQRVARLAVINENRRREREARRAEARASAGPYVYPAHFLNRLGAAVGLVAPAAPAPAAPAPRARIHREIFDSDDDEQLCSSPVRPEVAAMTPVCSVCMDDDKLACTIFPQCGHRCTCFECAQRCNNKCPICREVSRPIVIYDA